jgi:tetratricopeptide (TPR) repeat protein
MALSAQLELAALYRLQGKFDSAMVGLKRVGTEIPASDQDKMKTLFLRGRTFLEMNQPDSAFEVFDKLLVEYYPPTDSLDRLDNDVFEVPIGRIRLALQLGDTTLAQHYYQQALDYYARLIDDFPDSPVARAAKGFRGRTFGTMGEWERAIEQMSTIRDTTGVIETPALVLIGNFYYQPLNNPKKAVEIYREVLAREPDSAIVARVKLNLGKALLDLGNYEEARKELADYKKQFTRNPQLAAEAQLSYALTFELQGDWDRAMTELQWLMDTYPMTEQALRAALYIPEHFQDEGSQDIAATWYENATDFYQNVTQGYPGTRAAVLAQMFLADAYGRLEKWDEALAILDRISATAPGTEYGAQALYTAGQIAFQKLNDTLRADEYLKKLKDEYGTVDTADLYNSETEESTELIQ